MTANVAQMLLVSNRAGATSAITGTPTYFMRSVNFDGVSSAIYRNDWLANTPDSSVGTISMWVRIDTTVVYGTSDGIWGNPNHDVFVGITTNAGPAFIWLQVKNPNVTMLYRINSIAGSLLNNQWCHVLFSWNTNFNVGQKQGAVYINGVNQTDVPVDNHAAFATGYQSGPGAFGWTLGGGGRLGQAIKGDIGNFMMWTTMEVVQPGNTINAGDLANFLNNGAAVHNKVAELAYGQPVVSFHGDAFNFPINRGTGGAFQTQNIVNSSIYAAAIEHDYLTGNLFGSGLTTVRNSVAYANDVNGNWTAFPVNTPRITSKGLLVEEARTNSVRNNSMQGGVSGPTWNGAARYPTFWSNWPGSGGTYVTSLNYGTANGMDYIDVTVFGTGSSGFNGNFDVGTATAAANGQSWVGSVFIALINGDPSSLAQMNISVGELDNTGTLITNHPGANVLPLLTNKLQRFVNAVTFTNPATAFTGMFMNTTGIPGASPNWTIRFAWPQLEQGTFPTSPIRTTNAAVTRAADALSVTGVAFGGAYTMLAVGTPNAPAGYATNQNLVEVDDGTAGQRSLIRRQAGTGTLLYTMVGGGTGAAMGSVASWQQGVPGKAAYAIGDGSQGATLNGASVTATATPLPTSPTQVVVGRATGEFWNGYITRIAVWPTMRLPNGFLASMTT